MDLREDWIPVAQYPGQERHQHYFPRSAERTGPTDTVDCSNCFRSISPLFSTSSLWNAASINFIHSCSEILPFLSVSMRTSNCLTSSSPSASLSCGLGTAAFCATTVPNMAQVAMNTAMTMITDMIFVRLNMIDLLRYSSF